MSSGRFVFRQFDLIQDGTTWHVGTDSLLLGSWADTQEAGKVLDIGTGSGVLALMLAQRNPALVIDCVEIQHAAVLQARGNIGRSPWSGRIAVHHADISEFAAGHGEYDLVISNPPYFHEGPSSPVAARHVARQGDRFHVMSLPEIAYSLLTRSGKLCLVLPKQQVFRFIEIANSCQLYVSRRMDVRHSREKEVSIVLLELRKSLSTPEHETLILYDDGKATRAFSALYREYLLAIQG